MTTKELYQFTTNYFQKEIPVAETELKYRNPYELLVAVILSAQCTDKRINLVTPALFQKYPDAKSLSLAEQTEIYEYIKSVSYPNNKAKNLLGMARMLVEDFKCVVPESMEALQKLPGVGRKTANVIASVIYQQPTIAVDTHVFRVSQRIGLVKKSKTPLEVELQLLKNIPPNLTGKYHHWLILHGRRVCVARNPKCLGCGLRQVCKYFLQLKKK